MKNIIGCLEGALTDSCHAFGDRPASELCDVLANLAKNSENALKAVS